MRAVALGYHATEAWWVKLSLSQADRLLEGAWVSSDATPSPTPSPTTPIYVVIMKGDLGAARGGGHYRWAAVALQERGTEVLKQSDRISTQGLTLTPLQLASP